MLYIAKKSGSAPARMPCFCNPDELIEIDIVVDPAKALTSSPTVKNGSMAVLATEKAALFARLTIWNKR